MATVTGVATIDFGSTPVDEKDFVVTDAGFAAQANAEAYFMAESTVDNDADMHEQAGSLIQCVCEPPGAGTMTVRTNVIAGLVTGTFKLRYVAT